MSQQGELFEVRRTKRRRYKPPDYLFEGLCQVLQIAHPSRVDRGIVNKAAEAITEKGWARDDPKTRTEVHRRWLRFLSHPRLKSCAPNAMNLAKYWDQLDYVYQTVQPGGPSADERAERERSIARTQRMQVAFDNWKAALSTDTKQRWLEAEGRPMFDMSDVLWRHWHDEGRPGFEE